MRSKFTLLLLGLSFCLICNISADIDEPPYCDATLFYDAYGVLGSERLMFPVDVSNWPAKIGPERQLFVDNTLIGSRENVVRQMHPVKKYPGNPIFRTGERPWEQRQCADSMFVLRDETTGRFRMWYDLRFGLEGPDGVVYSCPTFYAESEDGIHWERPNLGIYEFEGSKNNNITLPEGGIYGLFHDPDCADPQKRWKALVIHSPRKEDMDKYVRTEGLYLYWSPDGLHWQGDRSHCILPIGQSRDFPAKLCSGIGDTTNIRWDPKLGKYVANAKILFYPMTLRTAGMLESDDLIHWSRPRMVMHRNKLDTRDTQIYEHITFPYESMWIGMARIMRTKHAGWKQVHVELTCSRDGRHWSHQFQKQPFIPLGDIYAWDSDYLIPARPGDPIVMGDELWFYYWGARRTDKRDKIDKRWEMHIGLGTLRRDGFVSVNGMDTPGTLVTRPLTFDGNQLFVNAEVAPDGYIKAELRDPDGHVIDSYRFDQCEPVTGDHTRVGVHWQDKKTLPHPIEDHVRIAFELKNAKLYSFWIR